MGSRLNAERTLCGNLQNPIEKNKCRTMISDIYKEGFEKGNKENSMCLSSVGSIFSFGQTAAPPQAAQPPPQVRLPAQESIQDVHCHRHFDLLDKNSFNPMVRYMIPENKTLEEYFKMVNIVVSGDVLDFSNMYYVKLSNISLKRVQDIIMKLQEFKDCGILSKVKKLYFYRQNFQKGHIVLIPLIFQYFPNVEEVRLGVAPEVRDADVICDRGINCQIVNDEQGRYILATRRSLFQGGLQRRLRRRTKKGGKQRRRGGKGARKSKRIHNDLKTSSSSLSAFLRKPPDVPSSGFSS